MTVKEETDKPFIPFQDQLEERFYETHRVRISSSPLISPSEAALDGRLPITYSMIVSCHYQDVEAIRHSVMELGGKIVFQNVGNSKTYLLREGQVLKILRGDFSELERIHKKKKDVERVE